MFNTHFYNRSLWRKLFPHSCASAISKNRFFLNEEYFSSKEITHSNKSNNIFWNCVKNKVNMALGTFLDFAEHLPRKVKAATFPLIFFHRLLHLKCYKFSKTIKNVLYHTRDIFGLINLPIFTHACAALLFTLKAIPHFEKLVSK